MKKILRSSTAGCGTIRSAWKGVVSHRIKTKWFCGGGKLVGGYSFTAKAAAEKLAWHLGVTVVSLRSPDGGRIERASRLRCAMLFGQLIAGYRFAREMLTAEFQQEDETSLL